MTFHRVPPGCFPLTSYSTEGSYPQWGSSSFLPLLQPQTLSSASVSWGICVPGVGGDRDY